MSSKIVIHNLPSTGTVFDDTPGAVVDTFTITGPDTAKNHPTDVTLSSKGTPLPFYYVDVSGGNYYSSALDGAGHVWDWGTNQYGELGNNTTIQSNVPVEVLGAGGIGFLSNVIQAASGHEYSPSLALDSSGHVWAWGVSFDYALGNGTSNFETNTPVEVVAGAQATSTDGFLDNVTQLAIGFSDSLALDSSGHLYAWGYNGAGELGNGTNTDSNIPVEVVGPGGTGFLSNVIQIAEGYSALALEKNGTVMAWGDNSGGELGNGTTVSSNTPVEVVGPGGTGFLSHIVQVAEGYAYFSVALDSSGHVWTWGYGYDGELGNGISGYAEWNSTLPVEVVGSGGVGVLSNIIQVAAGAYYSLALSASGNVYAWGDNSAGELGNGTTANSNSPVEVAGPGGTGFLSNVIAVSAGSYSSVALESNGTVWTWGDNTHGELGNNTTTNSLTPVEISGNTVTNGINLVNVVTEPGPTGLPQAGGIGLAGANNLSINDVLNFNTPASDFLVLRLDNPTFTAINHGNPLGASLTPAQLDAYNNAPATHFATFLPEVSGGKTIGTIIEFNGNGVDNGEITLTGAVSHGANYHHFGDFMPDHLIITHTSSLV